MLKFHPKSYNWRSKRAHEYLALQLKIGWKGIEILKELSVCARAITLLLAQSSVLYTPSSKQSNLNSAPAQRAPFSRVEGMSHRGM